MSFQLVKPLRYAAQTLVKARAVQKMYRDHTLLGHEARQVLQNLEKPQNLTEGMTTIHRMQRLYLAGQLGLQNDPRIIGAILDTARFPLWNQYASIDTTEANKEMLAKALYSGDPQRRAPILLTASDYTGGVSEKIVKNCLANGDEVDVWIDDALFTRRIFNVVNVEQSAKFGELMSVRREAAKRNISFNGTDISFKHIDPKQPVEITKAYNAAMKARKAKYSPDNFYTVTRFPTQKMADVDGMTLDELNTIFFNMAAVSPEELGQAHGVLKPILDEAKTLQFYNSDGTDFKVGINGMTFASSMMARNVPGGELYSGPEKYSAQGIIVSHGRFIPPNKGDVIENIKLVFDKGRIIDYAAENGQDILSDIINTDEGSRYLGEIAIGTNPALRRHVSNSMMVEKIGGSFHVAIGRSYKEKEYLGEPINVDNGNDSAIHWDITTMLAGKQGIILVDDKPIMKNGLYTDSRLSYLNGPNLKAA